MVNYSRHCTKAKLLRSSVMLTLVWMCVYVWSEVLTRHGYNPLVALSPTKDTLSSISSSSKSTARTLRHRGDGGTDGGTDGSTDGGTNGGTDGGTDGGTAKKKQRRRLSTAADVPQVFVRRANCAALFDANAATADAAYKHRQRVSQQKLGREQLLRQLRDCDTFKKQRQYLQLPTSAEEAEYPVAFSIMMYRKVSMAERLLRAIYRPQNVYCIHVDKKSPNHIVDAMAELAKCFDNVFLSSRRVDVTYGGMATIEQELACMKQLSKHTNKWEYLINLTGEEFPLKTNTQIVRMLKSFNGTNAVHGSIKSADAKRWGNLTKHPLPYNITLTKGSKLFAVTRGYVDFLLHSPVSHAFLRWLAHTKVPDETYFSSLQHSPGLGVPGAHTMLDEEGKHSPNLLRLIIWKNKRDVRCYGKIVRNVCIFSVKDLPLLASKHQMFANKFHADYQPLAYDCMEELHYNRTRQEMTAAYSKTSL